MNADDKIIGIDMVLLRLKIGVFEDVCDRFGETLKSPDEILRFAEELTNWLCAPVATTDIAMTVTALDGLYGEIEERIAKLEEYRREPAQAFGRDALATGVGDSADTLLHGERGEVTGAVVVTVRPGPTAEGESPSPIHDDGGQHEEVKIPVSSQAQEPKSTTPAPAETPTAPGPVVMPPVPIQKHTKLDGSPLSPAAPYKPVEGSLRARFFKLIEDAGEKGQTYAASYKPLGLRASFHTELSNYIGEWKRDGKVVVRFDGNSLNNKRFWLTEFAPKEPEAPRPPTQKQRIAACLAENTGGVSYPNVAIATGIGEPSVQAVLSEMVRAEQVAHDKAIGRQRLYFVAGTQPVEQPEPVAEAPAAVPASPPPVAPAPPVFQNAVEASDVINFLRSQGKIGAPAVEIWKALRAKPTDVLECLKDLARETRVKAAPSANGLKWFHADFAAHLPAYTPPPPPAPKEVVRNHVSVNQTTVCGGKACGRTFRPEHPGQTNCNICIENDRMGIITQPMAKV